MAESSVEAFKFNGILGNRPRELYYKILEAFMSMSSLNNDDSDWTMMKTSETIPDICYPPSSSPCIKCNISISIQKGRYSYANYKERETGCFGEFDNNDVNIHFYQKQPSSTGGFYAAITQLLGYKPDSDEWKVMALSGLESNKQKVNEYIEVLKTQLLKKLLHLFLRMNIIIVINQEKISYN